MALMTPQTARLTIATMFLFVCVAAYCYCAYECKAIQGRWEPVTGSDGGWSFGTNGYADAPLGGRSRYSVYPLIRRIKWGEVYLPYKRDGDDLKIWMHEEPHTFKRVGT